MPFIAFDLLGTLFTFDKVVLRIQQTLSNKVRSFNDMRQCKRFFDYWYQWSRHDYVACSHAGTYVPLYKVLKDTLVRALKCYFDDDGFLPNDDDIRMIMTAFHELEPHPEAVNVCQQIQHEGWDLWVLSTGGMEDTMQLLKRAQLETYLGDNILCCDDLSISKPHPKVFSELMRLAVHKTKRIENFYMIGSFASDLAGAKNVSIRTVFLNSIEKIYIEELYHHEPDMTGTHLADCVTRMFEFEATKKFK